MGCLFDECQEGEWIIIRIFLWAGITVEIDPWRKDWKQKRSRFGCPYLMVLWTQKLVFLSLIITTIMDQTQIPEGTQSCKAANHKYAKTQITNRYNLNIWHEWWVMYAQKHKNLYVCSMFLSLHHHIIEKWLLYYLTAFIKPCTCPHETQSKFLSSHFFPIITFQGNRAFNRYLSRVFRNLHIGTFV